MKNIELGIDLGTTNSEIAVMQGGDVQIVKNSYGDLYTPSVVGVNKSKTIIVGKKSYDAINKFTSDEEFLNNKAEIKRLMGKDTEIYFPRIQKKYKPEDISAEILKSLRADALAMYRNINSKGVVITVPAYFSTVQAEATKRAGYIAGFTDVILLQEPIAAAISYGFSKDVDENWLVYDLGGGTFDVALISSKNGDLRVLEHNGDNFLGGKDIDLAIIDNIVIPTIKKNHKLKGFNRGNEEYKAIFQRIKYNVEQAKIQLSRIDKTEIECDFKINEEEFFETIAFSREDLEKIATPLIKKTISLCNETIKNSGLDKKKISRIILVGGPTQLPCVRDQLEKSIGITVDTTVDPLTAVVKGACIYASGQQMDDSDEDENDENIYKIKLYYESLSAEDEELIVGEIPELKDNENDYFIQIQSTNNSFNSDKLKLVNGKFKLYIPLEKRKLNSFWVYLLDSKGNSLALSQDSFNITQGLNVTGVPLPKSIGLSFYEEDLLTKEAKNVYEIIFPKNSILPLSKTVRCTTVKTIKKDNKKENLGIYVYEGESPNIDRNMEICTLEVNGDEINNTILAGSDVEIKLSISESRTLEVKAYFPDLNQEFNARSSIYDPDVSIEQLNSDLNEVQNEFNDVCDICNDDEYEMLKNDIQEAQRDLKSASIDEDNKCKVHSKLKKIKVAIDNINTENSSDKVYNEFNEFLLDRDKIEKLCRDEKQKTLLSDLFRKGEEAQRQKDAKLLFVINQELDDLKRSLLFNDKNFLFALSADLYHNENLKNNDIALGYFDDFAKAMKNDDIDAMKSSLRAIFNLLPNEERNLTEQRLSGIKKL